MEPILNKEIQSQITQILLPMKEKIHIKLFTQKEGCESCAETVQLMQEMAGLNNLIQLSLLDFDHDSIEAKQYKIEMVPSFVILDKDDQYKGVKFNGIPAGHEINSMISALLEMSGVHDEIPDEFIQRIAKIDKPVNIKVFVTLSCPHCPGAVQKAHKLAMLNKSIVGEMIEAQTFSKLSDKFNVSGVPKIVINDTIELIGNQPFETFLASIESL